MIWQVKYTKDLLYLCKGVCFSCFVLGCDVSPCPFYFGDYFTAKKRPGYFARCILAVCKILLQCVLKHLPSSSDLCNLMITFAMILYPDQDRQKVGPDLDPNRLTLLYSVCFFLEIVSR